MTMPSACVLLLATGLAAYFLAAHAKCIFSTSNHTVKPFSRHGNRQGNTSTSAGGDRFRVHEIHGDHLTNTSAPRSEGGIETAAADHEGVNSPVVIDTPTGHPNKTGGGLMTSKYGNFSEWDDDLYVYNEEFIGGDETVIIIVLIVCLLVSIPIIIVGVISLCKGAAPLHVSLATQFSDIPGTSESTNHGFSGASTATARHAVM